MISSDGPYVNKMVWLQMNALKKKVFKRACEHWNVLHPCCEQHTHERVPGSWR